MDKEPFNSQIARAFAVKEMAIDIYMKIVDKSTACKEVEIDLKQKAAFAYLAANIFYDTAPR